MDDRNATISKIVGLCNRVPGSTHWNAAEWMYDEMAARAALAAQPAASAEPSQGHYKPPFDNCSIKLCDLPGQRRGEGKCHHPGTASALTASEAIEFRTAAA